MRIKNAWYLLLFPLIIACSGEDNYTPKPHGYFRIGLPQKEYTRLENDCPYTFEYNRNARYIPKGNSCWADIVYPGIRARLQLTYKNVTPENLDTLLGDGYNLAFKHTVKADGIQEELVMDEHKKIYGMLYRIRGDAASNAQFFMTDSTEHFLRGVLYFYAEPNEDSLRPVNNFMYGEILHLLGTLQWQNSSP